MFLNRSNKQPMAKVTVYKFTVYDEKKDYHPLANGMAMEEVIENISGARIIRAGSVEVEESKICSTGRYYQTEGNNNE